MIASLGGLESAATVLAGLPGDFPVPLVLFLHGRRRPADRLAELLQTQTEVPVRTAGTGEPLGPGVTVIPRGCTATFDHRYVPTLVPAGLGTGGDQILSSAAGTGARVLGVVLTGMLNDGAEGVRAVKRHGGRVLVEDPYTARAAGMPSAAIATGCVDFALPNARLAAGLVALSVAPGGAELFTVPTPAWANLGA